MLWLPFLPLAPTPHTLILTWIISNTILKKTTTHVRPEKYCAATEHGTTIKPKPGDSSNTKQKPAKHVYSVLPAPKAVTGASFNATNTHISPNKTKREYSKILLYTSNDKP